MVVKKAFFCEPTKAQITRFTQQQAERDLVDRILSLPEDQYLLVTRPLVPHDYESSWHFLRHGARVGLGLGESLEVTARTVAKERRLPVPVDFRIAAFNGLQQAKGLYSGYEYTPNTIRPYNHRDTRVRRVSLVECLEGARLYAYTHQVVMASIDVEHYTEAKAVEKDGAVFHVHVPSRGKGAPRYRFNITSVPIIDNAQKWGIAWGAASEGHDCLRGMYMGLRYASKEDSQVFNWCAHEIAAYIAMMGEMSKKGNRVPLQMSQIALPTQLTVDFYKRLCDSVLIHDEELQSKNKLRVLNKAEQEILLWGLVHKRGHHPTFFADGNVSKYDWNLRHMAME